MSGQEFPPMHRTDALPTDSRSPFDLSGNAQTGLGLGNGRLQATGISLLWGLLFVCVGCLESTPTIDPAVISAHRSRLLLAEEPDGALAVLDVRELLTNRSLDDTETDEVSTAADGTPLEVVIVGKVGGMPNPWADTEPDFPFKKDSATFFLVDPVTAIEFEDNSHGHEEHVDCPFCARAAAENIHSIAVVNFVDNTGQVVPISAQPLLDLPERAIVVVHGKAHFVGGEMLVIDADGVHVRQQFVD